MSTSTAKKVTAPKPAAKKPAAKPELIAADRVEKPAAKAAKPKAKAVPREYGIGASLVAGAKVVKAGSVGAVVFGIVENAPGAKAAVAQIAEKMTELDAEASLKIRAKDWVAGGDKRVGYVAGYVAWLVGNGNLVEKKK